MTTEFPCLEIPRVRPSRPRVQVSRGPTPPLRRGEAAPAASALAEARSMKPVVACEGNRQALLGACMKRKGAHECTSLSADFFHVYKQISFMEIGIM